MHDMHDLEAMLTAPFNPRWRRPIGKPTDDGGMGLASMAYGGLLAVLEGHLDARGSLRTSALYTDAGKLAEGKRLAKISRERLAREKWLQQVDRLRRRRDELRKAAKTQPAVADPSARMIAFAAIWQMLGDSDPLTVETAVRDAMARGDALTAEALMALPSIHPGALSDEALDRLESERLESTDPKLAGEVAALNEAVHDLERLVADVTEIIGESESGVAFGADPRAVASDGEDDGEPDGAEEAA